MKITLDIPDDLYRRIEQRAAEEGYEVNDFIVELLRRGLAVSDGNRPRNSTNLQET